MSRGLGSVPNDTLPVLSRRPAAPFFQGMSSSEGVDSAPAASANTAIEAAAPPAAIGYFARKLAHDLNNFATVVRTYSELLLNDLPDGSTHDDVAEIHRAADAMVVYLQRIARFARTASLRPVEFALWPAAQAVVDDFLEARDRAPVRISGASDAVVMADPHWLRDVLHELIDNARDVAPPTSIIDVVVHESRGTDAARWVIVDVCDRGPGFADSVAPNAEDPFVTTKDGIRGAGFGLTIASVFAEQSHGRLVRSREDDVTRVGLWLRVHG